MLLPADVADCIAHIWEYVLFGSISSWSWDPTSMTRPASMTTICVACLMVDRRCAMTSTVRLRPSATSASWIEFSVIVSSALVACEM